MHRFQITRNWTTECRKISAIKAYRTFCGPSSMGLKESKEFIEAVEEGCELIATSNTASAGDAQDFASAMTMAGFFAVECESPNHENLQIELGLLRDLQKHYTNQGAWVGLRRLTDLIEVRWPNGLRT